VLLPPRALDPPEGLASLLQCICSALLPAVWPFDNRAGVFSLDVARGTYGRAEPWEQVTESLAEWVGLPGDPPGLEEDTGLAGLVRGAGTDPRGHLVVADRLEERGFANLAGALRASREDAPRFEPETPHRSFGGFLGRLLDRRVLLYAAEAADWGGMGIGSRSAGRLLGLFIGPAASGGPARWVRWFLPGEVEGSSGGCGPSWRPGGRLS
jgi:hypothetical protein